MTEAAAADKPPSRIRAIDILRGGIMVLMAVDHVRVFAGVPAGGPNPAIFFTRWITHFCAPGFVFLAGTSAYLLGQRIGRAALVRFLLTRGLLLVFLELTYLRTMWTFNFDVHEYNLAGVIWMIGWCMVALAALSALPLKALGAFGGVIVAGHNLASMPIPVGGEGIRPSFGALARVAYFGGDFRLWEDGPRISILYVLIPWVGVISLGYAFGAIMTRPREDRDRLVRRLGLSAIAAFVVLRATRVYGDQRPWDGESALLFLNTSKYPASLLFLLMTLGPMLAILPSLEDMKGRVATWLGVFGRVPLFYYLLHIPLIHILAMGMSVMHSGAVSPWLFGNHPLEPPDLPDGYRWSLLELYAITALAVLILYVPCRWFDRVKQARTRAWAQWI